MSNADIREAHKLLDSLFDNSELSHAQIDLIRGLVPELPKQKTLEDVYREVCNAWYRTDGDVWKAGAFGELEDWLRELHEQLKGLIDAQSTAPALPEGMRLADHEEYGRVVVSPKPNDIGQYKIFHLDDSYVSGADVSYVEADTLTSVDAGTALKPPFQAELARPEFLDSPEDYKLAPNGTIVVYEKSLPWVKRGGTWLSAIADVKNSSDEMGATPRRAL